MIKIYYLIICSIKFSKKKRKRRIETIFSFLWKTNLDINKTVHILFEQYSNCVENVCTVPTSWKNLLPFFSFEMKIKVEKHLFLTKKKILDEKQIKTSRNIRKRVYIYLYRSLKWVPMPTRERMETNKLLYLSADWYQVDR